MKLTEKQIQDRLADFPEWEYEDQALHTSLDFENFREVFSTMTRIAFEAERLQHHPDWSNCYNELNITLTTHDLGGVTEKDFILLEAIETILGN